MLCGIYKIVLKGF